MPCQVPWKPWSSEEAPWAEAVAEWPSCPVGLGQVPWAQACWENHPWEAPWAQACWEAHPWEQPPEAEPLAAPWLPCSGPWQNPEQHPWGRWQPWGPWAPGLP